MHQQSGQIRRYWILLVLRGARYCGFGTVASDVFHRLVFFSNSLAHTVDIKPETARVLKAESGPFFPDYQWDLDRLVGMDLVDVKEIDWASQDGRYLGKYRINENGLSLANEILNDCEYFALTERAISEVVSAFSKTKGAFNNASALYDANYSQDTIRHGEVIDFGEWNTRNFSSEAAKLLYATWSRSAVSDIFPNMQDNVLYGGSAGSPPQCQEVEEGGSEIAYSSGKPAKETSDSLYRKTAFYLYAHYLNCQMQQQGHHA